MVIETHPFVPGFDYGIGFWNKENALERASYFPVFAPLRQYNPGISWYIDLLCICAFEELRDSSFMLNKLINYARNIAIA